VSRELVVKATAVEPGKMLGLRTNWISGKGKGVTFDLNSGAGVGNSALSLTVRRDGEVIAREVIDMAVMVEDWIRNILRWSLLGPDTWKNNETGFTVASFADDYLVYDADDEIRADGGFTSLLDAQAAADAFAKEIKK
jgi:hypothetical protein